MIIDNDEKAVQQNIDFLADLIDRGLFDKKPARLAQMLANLCELAQAVQREDSKREDSKRKTPHAVM